MTARLSGLFRPATKQMFARPADPLSIALSYEILRNGIGVLALAFPIVMIVGGGLHHIQPSLSAYYHFAPDAAGQYGAGTMRDAFVGMLCAIGRSEEHTSELQSLMRISYAVFCLKKKNYT